MNGLPWLFRPARSGFISKTIDELVGMLPELVFSPPFTLSLSRDNGRKPLSVLFSSLYPLHICATLAFNIAIILLLVTQLGHCTSPNDLGSDLTILINNDLLGISTSALCRTKLTRSDQALEARLQIPESSSSRLDLEFPRRVRAQNWKSNCGRQS
jgi:hypothetical protein